jgi:hypothetical protein
VKLELEMKSDNAVRSRKPAKTFKPLFRILPVGRAYVEKASPTMRSLDWIAPRAGPATTTIVSTKT